MHQTYNYDSKIVIEFCENILTFSIEINCDIIIQGLGLQKQFILGIVY